MFPNADQQDFDGLVEDIALNGLLEPIMLFEGKILDGRTRYLACKVTNTPPTFMPFTGDSDEAYSYVVSKNLHRHTSMIGFRLPKPAEPHPNCPNYGPVNPANYLCLASCHNNIMPIEI